MSEMRGAYGGGGDDVGVPCAIGDLDVVEPILLLALLAKDMAARGRQQQRDSRLIPCPHAYRYLDARTNRDMALSTGSCGSRKQQQRRGGGWKDERRRWHRYEAELVESVH